MSLYAKLLSMLCALSLAVLIGRSLADASIQTSAQPEPALQSRVAPAVLQPRRESRPAAPTTLTRAARMQVVNTATPTRTPTPINLGNFVWRDNGDGQQDAGEPGLSGVMVQLWNGSKTALLASTTTNSNGNYTLVAPLPGDYRIRVLLPAGTSFTLKNQTTDTLDSDINPTGTDAGFTDVISIASNVISITSIDAGIVPPPTPTRTPTPINLGNFVWHDLSGDGVQQAGEPGVGGVMVQLWNDSKTALLASTTTNSNGNYTLVAPLPGDYRIRVLRPTGSSFTLKNQGVDTTDSDINPTGIDAGFTDVISIASNVISITSIDAGLLDVQPSPTPTRTPTPTATATATRTPTSTATAPGSALSARGWLPLAQR